MKRWETIAVFTPFVAGVGFLAWALGSTYYENKVRDAPAIAAGFTDATEMNAAKAAGMTDPAAYRVHVEAEKVKLAAENAVREKNRRAAEAEGAALLRGRNRNPASNLLFVAENDVDQCLDALMLGEQLTFRLMDQDGQVAFFLLENDASFGAAYRELAQQIV